MKTVLLLANIIMLTFWGRAQEIKNVSGVPTRVRCYEVGEPILCKFVIDGIEYKINNDASSSLCNSVLNAGWAKGILDVFYEETPTGNKVGRVFYYGAESPWRNQPYFIYEFWNYDNAFEGPDFCSAYIPERKNRFNVQDPTQNGVILCNLLSMTMIYPSNFSDVQITAFQNNLEITDIEVTLDDHYEQNDSKSKAYDLTPYIGKWLSQRNSYYIQNLASQYDEDWYKINVAKNQKRLIVGAKFKHDNGNINLMLFDEQGNTLNYSNGRENNELMINHLPKEGTYYIKVTGENTGSTYDLFWLASNDDAYEDNDTRENASSAWGWVPENHLLSELLGPAVSKDDDWYIIYNNDITNPVIISCYYKLSEGDMDLSLYDTNGKMLKYTHNKANNDFISYPGGYWLYLLRVYRGGNGNEYDLKWSKEDNYETSAPNDNIKKAFTLPSNFSNLRDLNGPGIQKNEDWYKITFKQPTKINLKCTFLNGEGNIDLRFFDKKGSLLKESISYPATNEESISWDVQGEEYYIEVFGANKGNSYHLELVKN